MSPVLTPSELDMQAELVLACVKIRNAGWMVANDGGRFRMVRPPRDTDPAELPLLICIALSERNTHPRELSGDVLRDALGRARRALAALPKA
jgi:hypothetical protein